MKSSLLLSLFLLPVAVSLAAQPADPRPIASQQYEIVSRTYAVTDQMLQYCRGTPSEQLAAHRAAIDGFWQAYPEFRTLVEQSPYYAQVRNEAEQEEDQSVTKDVDPYYKAQECGYYMQLIQELTESGAAEVGRWTDTLRQTAESTGDAESSETGMPPHGG